MDYERTVGGTSASIVRVGQLEELSGNEAVPGEVPQASSQD
jgi:hypothetical protein